MKKIILIPFLSVFIALFAIIGCEKGGRQKKETVKINLAVMEKPHCCIPCSYNCINILVGNGSN